MRKTGMPKRGELVVCKIIDINPNSAFAELIEYRKKGMIHVSEIVKRWVRDIREFLKIGQIVVCVVLNVEGEHIYLSIKKVRESDKKSKLNEFKRESKIEKTLEIIAKKMGKTLDEMYDEVGYKLQEEFGSFVKAFEIAAKNPSLLKQKGIKEKWVKEIVEAAKRMKTEKTHEVIIELNLMSYKPDGIKIIKNLLKRIENNGFEVRYVSAPVYYMIGRGKNEKNILEKMEKIAKSICNEIKKEGTGDFKIKTKV